MLRRPLACLTLVCLFSGSLSAQSLSAVAQREVSRLAQAKPATPPATNPNKKAAFGLMAGGAALFVIGLSESRGVQATTAGTTATVSETGGSKTALEVLGVLAAAGGGFLYWRGEQKRHPAIGPSVRVSSSRVLMGARVTF
jgi:hypothetical protein